MPAPRPLPTPRSGGRPTPANRSATRPCWRPQRRSPLPGRPCSPATSSIRVILTTNFDRLTERALQEVGISPQVVHRPDQIDAIQPLAHSQVTVIKLHGDYADLEQRNTVDELETYPEAQQRLLERVLDEYGLIVCGWSADWDTALVRAVSGTRSRRYPMFWSHYGHLGEEARRLTAQHGAVVIEGKSADELFTGLLQQVEALDRTAWPRSAEMWPSSGSSGPCPT
ncbi:SIR2 family protein [Streptomyces goshikiensis]